eukprot:scaffold46143_cov26-Tisochrysis_lutea.AAC.3
MGVAAQFVGDKAPSRTAASGESAAARPIRFMPSARVIRGAMTCPGGECKGARVCKGCWGRGAGLCCGGVCERARWSWETDKGVEVG